MPKPTSPHHYPTIRAAVGFLNEQGFKIGKTKFNDAVKDGLVRRDACGQFLDEDLLAFAREDAAPPSSVKASKPPQIFPAVTPSGYIRTQKAAVEFLQRQNFTISLTKFNKDYNAGFVPCEQAGLFREEDLLAYARGETVTQDREAEPDWGELITFVPWDEDSTKPLKKSPIEPGAPQKIILEPPENQQALDPEAAWLPLGLKELLLGIMADGVINAHEAETLRQWLTARPDAGGYAVRTLRARLETLLSNGDFNCRDGKALFQILKGLLAGFLPDWAHDRHLPGEAILYNGRGVQGLMLTPEIPGLYDVVADIDLTATFCFTGIFAFGERADLEAAAVAHGGDICQRPVKNAPCYVVVGSVASPDWAHGNYGRKVEQGLRYREGGAAVKIISEDVWAAAL